MDTTYPQGLLQRGASNVVRTKSDSSTGNIWTFVHGPGVDDPLIAHMVQVAGNWSIGLKKTAYFATDGQGRQYGVGDAAGNDLTGPGYFMDWGGKYAGGTLNAATFAADRSTSNTMKQLSFFRNRFYDQQSGRWTQEDPIGVAGGVNLYQFNGNNPVSYTDPFGLCDPMPVCLVRYAAPGAAIAAPEVVIGMLAVAIIAVAATPTEGVVSPPNIVAQADATAVTMGAVRNLVTSILMGGAAITGLGVEGVDKSGPAVDGVNAPPIEVKGPPTPETVDTTPKPPER